MFYLKKIYFEIRGLRNDLLEIRDLLRQVEGNTSAEMLTIDLISRNPKLQPLVESHNAKAEGVKRRSKTDFISLQTIQRHWDVECDELKGLLFKNNIEYGTQFFKDGGFKGHVQSMIRTSDLSRVEKILKKPGHSKDSNKPSNR